MELMVNRRLGLFVYLLLLNLPCFGQTTVGNDATTVKFEVLSIRVMSPEEHGRKLPDVIGVDLSAKIRLSNIGTETIYFYTWRDNIIPWGHTVRKTDYGVVWLGGRERERKTSPGIDPVVTGIWVMLPEGASIEWEEFDATSPSVEIHAKTLFMKVGREGSVIEVFSNFYEVMARKSKPSS